MESGTDILKLKFEEAMEKLENITKELEDKGSTLMLEDSIKYYKKGILLSRHCKKLLEEARQEINILTKDENGGTEEIPFIEGNENV